MNARVQGKPIAGLVLGGEPRVNLLPPEVTERSRQRGVRARLAMLVVLAVIVVAAGYGYAVWRTVTAQALLASEQARSSALLDEQLSYSEASALSALVANTELAQQVAVSGEVVWADILEDVAAQAEVPVFAIEYTLTGRAPWQQYLAPAGALGAPRVASMQLRFASVTPVDVTAFQRRLAAVDVVADSTIDVVQGIEGGFVTTVMINLDELALTDRFASTEETQ